MAGIASLTCPSKDCIPSSVASNMACRQAALGFACVYHHGSSMPWPALCRDIKLENTLLDAAQPQPNVKICDFGYSKNEFVDSRPKTVSGTPDYIAPEVLMADQYDGKKADIWSCGVMLYVMVTGDRHGSGTPRQAPCLVRALP